SSSRLDVLRRSAPRVAALASPSQLSAIPARRDDGLARDPAGIVRSQEHRQRRDVLGLAESTERSRRDHLLLPIAADDADLARAFGVDAARIDRVDADLARAELLREHARDRV